jgi:hypothetical protein
VVSENTSDPALLSHRDSRKALRAGDAAGRKSILTCHRYNHRFDFIWRDD